MAIDRERLSIRLEKQAEENAQIACLKGAEIKTRAAIEALKELRCLGNTGPDTDLAQELQRTTDALELVNNTVTEISAITNQPIKFDGELLPENITFEELKT